jgi:hypothetical protein
MIHRFLQRDDVERDGLRQRQVTVPLVARRGFPPGVEVSVQRQRRTVRGVGIVGGEFAAGGEVGGERVVDDLRHPAQRFKLVVGNQAALSGERFKMRFPLRPTDV